MIVEIVCGSGFKGLASYVGHDAPSPDDPCPTTSERVEWSAVRNLPVAEDDLAGGARMMASTVRDAPDLKRLAGVSQRGRKCTRPAMHIVMAWPPGERLGREEEEAAVDSLLQTLGLGDHQTLIVRHSDTRHGHVHILVNRINPLDGRTASSSHDWRKASRWAEEYELRRGRIVCPQRVQNRLRREARAAAREAGAPMPPPPPPSSGKRRRDASGRPVEPAPGERDIWNEVLCAQRANLVPASDARRARAGLAKRLEEVRPAALRAAAAERPPPVPGYGIEELDRRLEALERRKLRRERRQRRGGFVGSVTRAIGWLVDATAPGQRRTPAAATQRHRPPPPPAVESSTPKRPAEPAHRGRRKPDALPPQPAPPQPAAPTETVYPVQGRAPDVGGSSKSRLRSRDSR